MGLWKASSSRSPVEVGAAGERRAVWFYRLRGYRILARNLRSTGGEIDLIVRRGRVIVFVEVKTRQHLGAGEPHEAVDRPKQLRIARLAERFLGSHALEGFDVRFDVLSLLWRGRRFDVTHFPNAFELASEPSRPWKRK